MQSVVREPFGEDFSGFNGLPDGLGPSGQSAHVKPRRDLTCISLMGWVRQTDLKAQHKPKGLTVAGY